MASSWMSSFMCYVIWALSMFLNNGVETRVEAKAIPPPPPPLSHTLSPGFCEWLVVSMCFPFLLYCGALSPKSRDASTSRFQSAMFQSSGWVKSLRNVPNRSTPFIRVTRYGKIRKVGLLFRARAAQHESIPSNTLCTQGSPLIGTSVTEADRKKKSALIMLANETRLGRLAQVDLNK